MKRLMYGTVFLLAMSGTVIASDLIPQPVVSPNGSSMSRLQHTYRATDIIGTTLRNEKLEALGSVNDLLVNQRNRVPYAIISVGGFLGLGSKLVAIPYKSLSISGDKILLPDMSPAELAALPAFHYLN